MVIHNNIYNQKIAIEISNFAKYSDELLSLITNHSEISSHTISSEAVDEILNGKATLALQKYVPLEVRKGEGIFFTGTALADRVAEHTIWNTLDLTFPFIL